jgi:hypothetical protein
VIGTLVATALLAALLYVAGLRARAPLLQRAGLLAALPALLFAAGYAHLGLDEAPWFCRLRALPGSELLVAGAGLTAGLLAPRLRWRVAPPLLAACLVIVPFFKPLLGLLMPPASGNLWAGGVCLQTTPSTCGPCSAATVVRALSAGSVSEATLAAEAHTFRGGTESWQLARALRRRGLRADFGRVSAAVAPAAFPVPSIAGVRLGDGIGHFVAVLGRAPDGRWQIGEPLSGLLVLDEAELRQRYVFTGFYLSITR